MKRLIVLVSLFLASTTAQAVEFQFTLQGMLFKDVFSTSIFGIEDASVPFQISFVADTDSATFLPAGAPVILSSGAGLAGPSYLFGVDDLTNFAGNIGNQNFSVINLLSQRLGTTSSHYSVLVAGSLSNPAVQLSLRSTTGELTFGRLNCLASCQISPIGEAHSYLNGSSAELRDLQSVGDELLPPPTDVPEPASLSLVLVAMGALGYAARRRKTAI